MNVWNPRGRWSQADPWGLLACQFSQPGNSRFTERPCPPKVRWGTIEQDTRNRSLASTRPIHLHEKEKKLRQTCSPSLTLVYHQTVELVSKPESVARFHLCPCRVTEPHLAPSLLRRDSLPRLPWSLQMVG